LLLLCLLLLSRVSNICSWALLVDCDLVRLCLVGGIYFEFEDESRELRCCCLTPGRNFRETLCLLFSLSSLSFLSCQLSSKLHIKSSFLSCQSQSKSNLKPSSLSHSIRRKHSLKVKMRFQSQKYLVLQ
jgi:hypothetical protein